MQDGVALKAEDEQFLYLIFPTPVKKAELTAGGIRCADHVTPSIRKSWH
jgi:hypothetical protein